LLADTNKKLPG